MAFNAGDKVKVTSSAFYPKILNGEVVFYLESLPFPYLVLLEGKGFTSAFKESELELIEKASPAPKPVEQNTQLGRKFDADKTQYNLIPAEALKEVADVLTFGAKKYAPDGWRHVPNADVRFYNASLRHTEQDRMGEEIDPESGKYHLAHAICSMLFRLQNRIEKGRE